MLAITFASMGTSMLLPAMYAWRELMTFIWVVRWMAQSLATAFDNFVMDCLRQDLGFCSASHEHVGAKQCWCQCRCDLCASGHPGLDERPAPPQTHPPTPGGRLPMGAW